MGVYVTAWTSGALDSAAAQASVSFTLCLHHIAGYFFGSSDAQDKLAVKTVARTLVRSSMRKSQQQVLQKIFKRPLCNANSVSTDIVA